MVNKIIIRKVFVNKKNNQLIVPLSRKEIRISNPTIKFGKHLFVRLEIFNRGRE